LTDNKEALQKQREEAEKRKAAAAARCSKRSRTSEVTERDPALDDDMEVRLWMGLDILTELAREIHVGVVNTNALSTEPGCRNFCEDLDRKNTALLISVPRKLESYPGRSGKERGWMGSKAVRFYQEQRGTVPAELAAPAAEGAASAAEGPGAAPAAEGAAPAAEGAAPAAEGAAPAAEGAAPAAQGAAPAAQGAAPAAQGAAPAAQGAAPANSDGEASTPPSPVGAGGPATKSKVPGNGGKVRCLPGNFATEKLKEPFLRAAVLMPGFTSLLITRRRRWPRISPVTSMR
jgi:hypothetical protein